MKYRNLGRTGVKVSELCLGTMNFGYRTSEADTQKIVDRAIEAGINFIDTANFYGQPLNDGTGQGTTEKILGKVLKGKRGRIVLATKGFALMDASDPNARGNSRRHLIQACEDSLRRLDTDHVDLYQLHRPHPDVPIDETLRALDDLVRSGKVRYIGTSRFDAWRIMEGLSVSKELGLNRFVTEQPKYNLINRGIEREVVPMALSHQIALLPYSPLAGGILTGKYRRGEDYPEGSRFVDEAWGDWATGFMHDQVYEVLDLLAEMAQEKGCTVSQLSLAWALHQPGVTSPIIGPRTLEHLEDNLGAVEVEITDEDRQRLDAVAPTPE